MKTHFDAIVVGSGISGGWGRQRVMRKRFKNLGSRKRVVW